MGILKMSEIAIGLIGIGAVSVIICLITSAVLCCKEKHGWGWFLFVAFILMMGILQIAERVGAW
jgi:hypothetical protein